MEKKADILATGCRLLNFFLGIIHTYSVYVSLKSRNYFYIFLVGMSAKLFTLHFVKQVRNIYLACRIQNRYLNPLTLSLSIDWD